MTVDLNSLAADDSAAMNAAREQDKQQQATDAAKSYSDMREQQNNPVAMWMLHLPKNITVGLMDAAVNTVDAIGSFGKQVIKNETPGSNVAEGLAADANVEKGLSPQGKTPDELRQEYLSHPAMVAAHGPVRQAFMDFRDQLAQGSGTADEVTQGVAQFAIPMLGWSRLLGAQKLVSLASAGAETLTAATALAPHAGRNADLLAAGKQVEGKLGDALNTIAPDGSALNAYINYMTDRTNETEAQGRFKNVVDSLVTSGVTATILKTGAATLKAGMDLPGYVAANAGIGPVGHAAQEGKIVFHGTPHDFNEFDSSKIGTGEGNQTYGHGLYFAEDAATAGSYQKRLSFRSPDLSSAIQQVANFNGSKQKAYTSLMMKADSATDPNVADGLRRQAGLIKSGAVEKSGKLMHVDIADEHIANMLEWNKPLDQQPESVQKAISNSPYADYFEHEHGGEEPVSEAYRKITADHGGSQEMTSGILAALGIPGIKYLDKGSRNAGTGTHNIVLFNAKHATIVKKD